MKKNTFAEKVKNHVKEHKVDFIFMGVLAALNVGVYLGAKNVKKN